MHPTKKLLVLEDDPGSQFVYKDALSIRAEVFVVATLAELKAIIQKPSKTFDLLIADLMVPDGNFLRWIGAMRETKLRLPPFIVVSSADDLDILRQCYGYGAIDYLTKPFRKNELIIKVERAIESTHIPTLPEGLFAQNALAIPTAKGDVALTLKESAAFLSLSRAGASGVYRKDLQKSLWDDEVVSEKALDVHIHNLRKKLEHSDYRIALTKEGRYRLTSAKDQQIG